MNRSTRILSWIVTAPITILVIIFAVSNLDKVTLHLVPLPDDITISVWALTLILLFVGFLLGSIVTWIGDRRRRREARSLARRAAELEQLLAQSKRQIGDLERRIAELQPPPPLPVTAKLPA